MCSMDYKKLLKYSLLVLLILVFRYLFSVLVNYTFPYREWVNGGFILRDSKLSRDLTPSYDLPSLWGRWDTTSYVDIAMRGYDEGPFGIYEYKNWAFFPLYPLLIKLFAYPFSLVGGGLASVNTFLMSGVFVSSIFLALSLYVLDEILTRLKLDKIQKSLATVLFLAFPASYFNTLIYTESLHLLLTLLLIYFLFTNRIYLSFIVLSLSLVTRVNSVVLLPVIIIWFLYKNGYSLIKQPAFLAGVLTTALPITSYFLYMKSLTGEFFAPVKIQHAWNNSYEPFGVFTTYLRVYGLNIRYEFILSIILLLLVLAFIIYLVLKIRRIDSINPIRDELALLGILLILSFCITSGVTNITSIYRYVSVFASLFILIPVLIDYRKHYIFYSGIICISLLVQSLFFIYFLTNSGVYGF